MNMNKIATLLVAGTVALTLGACGVRTDETGDKSGQPTFNPDGSLASGGSGTDGAVATDLDVRVLSDVNRIETGGSDVASITALVTDGDNNAVADQAVSFSATGGVLQDITTSTDVNGEASATLKLLQDFSRQDIVVTVTAETFSGQVVVSADGSELEISGPSNLVEGAEAELAITLTAGNGEPISNQTVSVTSAAGNTLRPAVAVTDADGRVDVTVGSANGNDSVTVLALGDTVNATHAFNVSTDSLSFELADVAADLEVGKAHDIDVFWTTQGQPVAGRALRFAITAGQLMTPSTITTNASGAARVTVASNSAGEARITVEDAIDGEPSNHADVEFIATTPAQVEIDASSSRVPVRGTSTVLALVTDANGNPVKNSEVVFMSSDLKGGQLNPAFDKTGADGVASVTFTAGSEATELNEIEIAAEVEGTVISDRMQLTVVERVLNVTIGTSNKVSDVDELSTQYFVPFVVQVADGGGTPLENADVSLSIAPISYRKGWMALNDSRGVEFDDSEDWSADHWAMSDDSIGCPSEDLNGNRVLDVDAAGNTEDNNGNGSLDPQDPASLSGITDGGLIGGTLTTDANGSGYFRMIYPASNSLWAYVEITARAKALGAEAEDAFRTHLLLPAPESDDEKTLPSNHTSPYGVDVTSCASDD